MGMFDYIRCKMPLPDAPADVEWFQTKDVPTDQLYLEKWTITEDGRLVKHGVRYENRSDPDAKSGTPESFAGAITPVPVPEDDKEIIFHGDIGFGHYDAETREDWHYTARFTEGRCVRVFREPPRAPRDRTEGR